MDISETWKRLEKEKLERPIEGDLKPGDHSLHPVSKLKRNYFIKTMMMVAFLVLFAVLFLYFDHWLIRSVLGVVVGAYTIFLLASYSMYRKIRSELPVDGTLLEVLTETREQISRALRFETISSLLVYPFAGTAGYLGGYTVSGKDISRLFDSPEQIAIYAGVLIVFGVAGYFLGKKLTHEGYGKSLNEISRMIEQMKGG